MRKTMTRRTFLQAAAATAAAGTLALSAINSGSALAETDAATRGDIKRIRSCCRGCGKMECGVWVTVENGRAIKIEGDESARHSAGNCCTKSQASLQAAYHPGRLHYPMKRTTARDANDPGWVRISWDEAYQAMADGYKTVTGKYGGTSLISMRGTSRMWAMGANCWTVPLGGKNGIDAVQICKGPRRAAGSLTVENAMFFNATNDDALVYVQWGTDQSQSNYDDSCRSLVDAFTHAKAFISIDPRKSNAGKEADYHLALRPGSDMMLIMAWTRIVMDQQLYDDLLVKRWSNAPFLWCEECEPTDWNTSRLNHSKNLIVKTRLLTEADVKEGGSQSRFMVWDNIHNRLSYFDADENVAMWEGQTEHDLSTTGWEYERGGWVPDPAPFPVDIDPAIWGEFDVTLKDGRQVKVKPVFQKYWDECVSEWTVEKAAEACDLDPNLLEEACLVWATRIDPRRGNGGLNIQLAPEQTGNSVQTYRAVYNLIFMTDNYDVPAGNRGMTRAPIDAGGMGSVYRAPQNPNAPVLSNWDKRANVLGTEQFPFTRWWGMWSDATSVYNACHTGEPYPIKCALIASGDFMNQSNAIYAYESLLGLDFIVTIDLWHHPSSEIADILMPAQHWLEIPGWPRMSQGASGAYGATCHCIEAPGEAKFDPQIMIEGMRYLDEPYYDPNQGDAWDQPIELTLDDHVKGTGMKWTEYERSFQENGWWEAKVEQPERWGTYRRYQMGYLRQADSTQMTGVDWTPGMTTPTMKCEIWSTIMETYLGADAALPQAKEPPLSPISTPELFEEYPFNMTTGRRIPVYFHSEHRQLPWCREQWLVPRMEINPTDAESLGIEQGDWCWIESKWGKVRQVADLSHGIKPGVINCEHQWWYPELEQADKGFKLSCINCLVNKDAQDPVGGSTQLRAYPVKVYKATAENSPFGNPCPCGDDGVEIIHTPDDPRLKEWLPTYEGRE